MPDHAHPKGRRCCSRCRSSDKSCSASTAVVCFQRSRATRERARWSRSAVAMVREACSRCNRRLLELTRIALRAEMRRTAVLAEANKWAAAVWCVRACVRACACARACVCVRVCVCVCMCVCVHAYVCICMHMYAYVCICMRKWGGGRLVLGGGRASGDCQRQAKPSQITWSISPSCNKSPMKGKSLINVRRGCSVPSHLGTSTLSMTCTNTQGTDQSRPLHAGGRLRQLRALS